MDNRSFLISLNNSPETVGMKAGTSLNAGAIVGYVISYVIFRENFT
jgi:hypothetical protein